MKTIKNIIMTTAALAATGISFTSCDIDLLPLNEVVYENYWTNKDDVESVVASCYEAVQAPDYQKRQVVWGELRSDNTAPGPNITDDGNISNLMKGSLKTTNDYCNWSSIYNAINQCNVVLAEAPLVAEKDPNYTSSDLRINQAECRFLRAYSYFLLVKTFKQVPFSFEPSLDDNQVYRVKQTPGEVIIDTLIADIEECKNYAPNRYSDVEHTLGRVTRPAMYALLADLYLWRASDANLPKDKQNELYRKCIDCCDWIIDYKMKQYDNNDYFDFSNLRGYIDKEVFTEYGYPLLAEELTQGTNNSGPQATRWIFGSSSASSSATLFSYSYESIFELAYYYGNSSYENKAVREIYGNGDGAKRVAVAAEKVFESVPKSGDAYTDSRLFSVPSDYRSLASFYYNENSGGYYIYKYVVTSNYAGAASYPEYGSVGSAYKPATETQSFSNAGFTNWVVYRLSEIMLFRAEAEIELANNMAGEPGEGGDEGENTDEDNGADEETPDAPVAAGKSTRATSFVHGNSLFTAEELYDDAFTLISAVYRRSNPYVKKESKYAPTKPTTYDGFHELLMNERRREFLFEGKRYFDLVRSARRVGNTQEFRKAMASKYSDASPAVAAKMVQMDFLYMPVLKSEKKANPLLEQNSCYLDEEENIKN